MEYWILGQVVVTRDGKPIAIRPKAKALMVLLLLSPDHGADYRTIRAHLWPGERSTSTSLYRQVSDLRNALGRQVVPDATSGSYRIVVSREQVDLFRYDDRLETAGVLFGAERASAFAEVLREWKDDPFPSLEGKWFDERREELIRRWKDTRLAHLKAELEAGAVSNAIAAARRAMEKWPHDLRFSAFLLRTVYTHESTTDFREAFEECGHAVGESQQTALDDLRKELESGAQPAHRGVDASTSYAPQQLPAHRTNIIGRSADLNALCAVLTGGRPTRIAALTGTAGVGKSVLAYRGADTTQDLFPGGILYIDLHGFSEQEPLKPEQVLARFLNDLGVKPQTPTLDGLTAAYRSTLAQRAVLIVLDNARNADQVRPLLPGPGPSAAVVTSRNALVSLVAREGADPIPLTLLSEDVCVALLTAIIGGQRVQAEPEAAAEVMRHCAGLPLAVIVLAARLLSRPTLSLKQVLEELRFTTHKLSAFINNEADLNLRAVLATSHAVLSRRAADLFWRLSVHPGPTIGRSAAVALTGVSSPADSEALDELRAAHLIDELAYNRFALHDLMRAYAEEKSAEVGDAERRLVSERMLDHLLHNARVCDEVIVPGRNLRIDATPTGLQVVSPEDARAAMAWFAAEYDVIMAAVEHAVRHELHAHAWLLPLTLTTFQWRSNRYLDARQTLQVSLRAAEAVATPEDQAMVLRLLAGTDRGLGQPDLAKIRLATAIDLAKEGADELGYAHGCHGLAVLQRETDDSERAEERFREALAIYRRFDNVEGQAGVLNGIGCTLADRGQHDEAVAHCTEALALFRMTEDLNGQANALDSLARIRQATGQFSSAVTEFRAAVDLYRQLDYRKNEAHTLRRLAAALAKAGDQDEERRTLTRALQLLRELRDPDVEAVATRLEEMA